MRCILGQVHRQTILSLLRPGGRMLEWGSGGSTLFFADRLPPGATLTSIEHDPQWHAKVAAAIGSRDNVSLLLRPATAPLGRNATIEEENAAALQPYIRAADGKGGVGGFDVVFVDGYARSACIDHARTLLRPGGVVFVHDAQRPWYDAAKALLIEHGTIGSCPEYPGPTLWWGSTVPPAPAASRAALPPVICFYTRNTPYEQEVRGLMDSCRLLGLEHDIAAVEPLGAWEKNCAYKARHVLEKYLAFDRAVLWVDADAVIHSLPMLLAGTDADFAVTKARGTPGTPGWEFNSATVFFNRTELGEAVLRAWVRCCEADSQTWDQIHLDTAWEEVTARRPLRTLWLPDSYARIFDAPAGRHAGDKPVIEQFQASRRFKGDVSSSAPATPTPGTDDLIAARRAGRPRAACYDDRLMLAATMPPPARRCIAARDESKHQERAAVPSDHAARTAGLPASASGSSRRETQTARLLASLASGADKLNFGCGDHPLPREAGWINIDNGDGHWYGAPDHPDVIALDIFEALEALPDACASLVYSEHVFEHFTLSEGHDILHEWARILRPGGTVRIVCPDLESEARLFLRQIQPADDAAIDAHRARWLDGRSPLEPGETLTRAMVLNASMRLDGHKFLYDQQTLAQSLRLAGFDSITRERFGHSRHAALNAIDSHDGGDTGRSWVPSIALVMEGARPVVSGAAAALARRARTVAPSVPTALDRATAQVASLRAETLRLGRAHETIRHRLIDSVAQRCAAAGYRRIALYGAGRHTVPITRQPWAWRDIQIVAILDDHPSQPSLRGIPILRPADAPADLDAVIISSDAHEHAIFERAAALFAPRRIPVLRIYDDPPAFESEKATRIRLVERWGLSDADARWLTDNRSERHDATLPILPPQRTELHLRRYEFAAQHAAAKRVLDAACGTGYGSALLLSQGRAASVVGVDIDPRAVDYARRRHGVPGVSFLRSSAAATTLPAASIDLVASFETIEHIDDPAALLAEFARVLVPGGALILSTPNDAGLTAHHVHSFTRESLAALMPTRFTDLRWFGQWEGATSCSAPPIALPVAGISPLTPASPAPDSFIILARRRD